MNWNFDLQCLCLIFKAVLPEDSRNIAVTYYQLGIAQGFNMKYEEAVDTLGLAIGVLKKRIDNLANKTESVDESKKTKASSSRKQSSCHGNEDRELDRLKQESGVKDRKMNFQSKDKGFPLVK